MVDKFGSLKIFCGWVGFKPKDIIFFSLDPHEKDLGFIINFFF